MTIATANIAVAPGHYLIARQRESGYPREAYVVRLTQGGRPVARLAAHSRAKGDYWTKPLTLIDQDFIVERQLDPIEIQNLMQTHGDPAALTT